MGIVARPKLANATVRANSTGSPEKSSLRLVFVGNQGNNAYKMCKWGRELGYNVDLLVCSHQLKARSLPELVDPELSSGYPKWITVLEGRKDVFAQHPVVRDQVNRRYDGIVTAGKWGVSEAHNFDRAPLFHFSLGGDIGSVPWRDPEAANSKAGKERQQRYRDTLYRYEGIFSQFQPTLQALAENGLGDKAIEWAFPEDVYGNRTRVDQDAAARFREEYGHYDRVFLWLSRLVADPATFGHKAPDCFVRSLEHFFGENPEANVRVVIGYHGPNREEIRSMIEERGLASVVDWIEHQPYRCLLALLSMPNAVVFDELDAETTEVSGIARDAITVGCPIVKSIDVDNVTKLFGPGCPIIQASSDMECKESMVKLVDDAEFTYAQQKTRAWGEQYLHYPTNVYAFYEYIQRICATRWSAKNRGWISRLLPR